MILECVEADGEIAVLGGDGVGIVPLNIMRCAVPDIHARPKRVVAVVECPPGVVELVAED